MFSLKDGENTIQGTPALMEHATEFYKQLFGPVADSGVRLNDSIWDESEKLDETDRNLFFFLKLTTAGEPPTAFY
jgi:hypothetical protein